MSGLDTLSPRESLRCRGKGGRGEGSGIGVFPELIIPALPWRTAAQRMPTRGWPRCSTGECVVAVLPPYRALAAELWQLFASYVFAPRDPSLARPIGLTHRLATCFPCPLVSPPHHPSHHRLTRRFRCWPALLPADHARREHNIRLVGQQGRATG